ncbi:MULTISPECIES: ABC transporter substrate-binding protein [unclassified Micromonospora]|uniref:ABC transporter substrate-binding protein n=1 Tax=unclassified Micromonospora TaxID=2617518 RepID=UPI0033A0ED60
MRRHIKITLATLMVALLAAGCGDNAGGDSSGGGNSGVTDVNVGIVPFSPNAVLFQAIEGGIFKKHGLNVKTTSAAAPTPIVAAMVSGQQQFGFVTTPVLINANAAGTAVKCVAPIDGQVSKERDSSALVTAANSGINSLADLSGKKIAVVQLSSINLIGAKKLAEEAGATNIEWVVIPFPQMPQALADGRVDAAVVTTPYLETALKAGAKALAHPSSDLWPEGTVYCYGATAKYLDEHPDVAKAFQDAMTEAITYTKDHEDEVKQTLVKYLKLTPEAAKEQILPTNYVPEINVASIGDIQNVMEAQGAIKTKVNPADLVWQPAG